jgi:hypothetical protein
MNHARDNHVSAALNGKIYVVGSDANSTTVTLEQYDPSTNVWSTKGSLDVASLRGGAALNNRLYVHDVKGDIFEIEPETGAWGKLGMNTTSLGVSLTGAEGKLYAVGGVAMTSDYLSASPAVYATTEMLPLVKVGSGTLDPLGGEALVPVRASRVPVDGWSELELAVRFDPAKLIVTDVTPGPALAAGFTSLNVDYEDGLVTFSWVGRDIAGGGLVTSEGTLINIGVDVVDTVAEAGSTPLTIDTAATKLFGASGWQDEQFRTSDGAVDIFIRGDVNGDGQITVVDSLTVAQYAEGQLTMLPEVDAADANCDNEVNHDDAVLVSEYYVGLVASLDCSIP